jgi:hypothetical protein
MLVAIAVLVTTGLGEAVVRFGADDGMQFDLEMWKYAKEVKTASDDPLIAHEHAPNRSARLMGVEVTTNAEGLRDRDIPIEPTPGRLRVMMLGDSLTFGWGVSIEDTFSKRIEKLYASDGVSAEVINTGVGNWNTVQQVRYFLTKGYQYKPEIVVLNFFVNDAEPVPESRPPSLLMRHCYLCVFVAGRIDTLRRSFKQVSTWDEYYLGLYGDSKSPGWLAARDAMKQLADYCKANGIRLIIASLPELHDVSDYKFDKITSLVRSTAHDLDVQFVDLLPSVQQAPSSSLWVTPPDPHPNSLAHKLMASGIYSALRSGN